MATGLAPGPAEGEGPIPSSTRAPSWNGSDRLEGGPPARPRPILGGVRPGPIVGAACPDALVGVRPGPIVGAACPDALVGVRPG